MINCRHHYHSQFTSIFTVLIIKQLDSNVMQSIRWYIVMRNSEHFKPYRWS